MRIILFATLMAVLTATGANAEKCRMTGCRGSVGYVFMHSRTFGEQQPTQFRLDAQTQCRDTDENPFGGRKLPLVNDVAQLRADANLYEEVDIQKNLSAFRLEFPKRIGAEKACRVDWNQPHAARTMETGAKLRILGYRTFSNELVIKGGVRDTHAPQQLLFVLVLVEKD